jgi:hypothetical protein
MADFQRSIPVKKALDANTLLAYEMNGAPLPVKHGFPLRAVVPGWAGDSWAKWLTNIRVLSEPANGFWMKNAYLRPPKPVAPGTVVPAADMIPVTSLRVKSVIAAPSSGANVDAGKPVAIQGAAWSGDGGAVSGVEVSTDRGRTWKPARLTSPLTQFGWRLWEFLWTPASDGHYTILSRARDMRGDVQPLVQEWNPSGYLWNVVARVDVQVGRSPGAAPSTSDNLPSLSEPAGFRETCLVCHDADVIRQQRLTRAQWEREIDKMTTWGARVQPQQRQTLLDYLQQLAGPRK